MPVFYLCDRRKSCSGSFSCGTQCKHTIDIEHAVNGPCTSPEGNDRFKVAALGEDPSYVEFEDVYHEGKPGRPGWYDCIDKDGQYHRLKWFVCNLNPKKYYYTDLQGQVFGKPEDGIRWTGEASDFR